MVALTTDRNTTARLGDTRVDPVAAAVKVWAGSIVMRNAAGLLTKGATATGGVGVGRAEATVDNLADAAEAQSLEYRMGVFRFANSAAADQIVQADVGKPCFIVDDQTVAKTDGAGTPPGAGSRAGIVDGIEGAAVWVRFDEAVTRGA
jgi:hypothetical protein